MKELKCQHVNHGQKCYGDNIYSKVGNEKRMALLNMVKLQGKSLKDAAEMLDINYSTAKTILRVYRIENRILKKTPYQKRSKKCLFTVNHSAEDSRNSFDIEMASNMSVFSHPNLNDRLGESSSNSNLNNLEEKTVSPPKSNLKITCPIYNSVQDSDSTQHPEEMQKTADEFVIKFNSILKVLQLCINEVATNELTIKNICESLKTMNYPNLISQYKQQFSNNFQNNGLDNKNNYAQKCEQSQTVLKPIPISLKELMQSKK